MSNQFQFSLYMTYYIHLAKRVASVCSQNKDKYKRRKDIFVAKTFGFECKNKCNLRNNTSVEKTFVSQYKNKYKLRNTFVAKTILA